MPSAQAPDSMTPDERRREVAAILALGVLRFRRMAQIGLPAIGAYAGGTNESDNWSGSVPTTTDQAIARLARLLKQHLGTQIPE